MQSTDERWPMENVHATTARGPLRSIASQVLGIILILASSLSDAQTFPNKPLRFIVPDTPGTAKDVLARIMGPSMGQLLGQPIIIENKPGAGNSIGLEYVAKQVPADGYTIAVNTVSTLASLPIVIKDLRFNVLEDLPPVIGLAEGRYFFGSSSKFPWKTFSELVANAKANPGKLNFGSPSAGVRLPTEAIMHALDLNVVHVPYAGGAPYQIGLSGGEVQMGFLIESQARGMGEKFRILAVSGQQRAAAYPDIPTFAEVGVPQIKGLEQSLNVRVGTPRAIIDKLYSTASQMLQQPEIRAQFLKVGFEITEYSPEVAAKRLAEEAKLYMDVAKKIGVQPQ